MEHILYLILIAGHFVANAAILGGWFAHFKNPTVTLSQWYGSMAMIVTGLSLAVLVSIIRDPNHMQLGVKLLVGLVIFVAALLGRRKINRGEPVSKGLSHAVGGMALINVLIAVFW
ncbi:MAG: hypothetical protein Q4G34_05880 [Micrococcus sp.]|nr:hypothetical protein [Micrococcus sp.]